MYKMNYPDKNIDELLEKLSRGELTAEEAATYTKNIKGQTEHSKGIETVEKKKDASPAAIPQINKISQIKTVEKSPSSNQLEHQIESYLVKKIMPYLNNKEVSLEKNFMDLGIDSLQMIEVAHQIEQDLGIELYPTLFFEYQNIKELVKYFKKEHAETFAHYFHSEQSDIVKEKPISSGESTSSDSANQMNPSSPVVSPRPEAIITERAAFIQKQKKDEITPASTYSKDIAIIGMAGRLAESANLNEFWEHIKASRDLIKEIPPDHFDFRPWFDKNIDASNKTYSKWGSFIDDVDKFDPAFFGISGREAIWLDPQLRLLLQVIQETIDDAGCGQKIFGTKTGVYVGVMFQEYWDEIVRAHLPINDYEPSSNPMSSISARISYTYDLQGASIPLDNACASSLTAIHLACRAMQAGECDMAFVS